MLELREIRADGEFADGHDEPPGCARSPPLGHEEVRMNRDEAWALPGGLGPSRGREAPCAPARILASGETGCQPPERQDAPWAALPCGLETRPPHRRSKYSGAWSPLWSSAWSISWRTTAALVMCDSAMMIRSGCDSQYPSDATPS